MDQILREKLLEIESHIEELYEANRKFLLLDGSKKSLLARLTTRAHGSSHASKEAMALTNTEWVKFSEAHAEAEALMIKSKHKHDLLIKSFDAAYLSLKVDSQTIKRSR